MSKLLSRLVVFVASLPLLAAAADLESLVRRLPSDTNLVAAIRVNAIRKSPIAMRNHWDQESAGAFAESPIHLPADPMRIVIGNQLDWDSMISHWGLVLMEMKAGTSPQKRLARGDDSETVAGCKVFPTVVDALLVQFAPLEYALYSPANRQAAARWIGSQAKADGPDSAYLRQVLSDAKYEADFLLAMDLSQIVSPTEIRRQLEKSAALKGHPIDLVKLTELSSDIRGASLQLSFGAKCTGKIRVEFSQPAKMLNAVAKPLLLEVLARHGATVGEMQEWEVELADNHLDFHGELAIEGIQRVASIVDYLTPTDFVRPSVPSVGTTQSPSSQDAIRLAATQRYFHSMARLIDALRTPEGTTSGSVGLWMERYARKLDCLPILDVDPDLVNFCGHAASSLRANAYAYRGVGIRVASARPDYNITLYNGGYESNESDVHQLRRQVTGSVAAGGLATWQQIDDALAAIRHKLTERYKVEF